MEAPQEARRSFLEIGVHRWLIGGFSFLISLLFSIWYAFVIGRNLGLFFSGLVLASLLTPLLIVSQEALPRRLSIVGGIVIAIAIVWLGCVFNDTITLWEWSRASLLLLVFAFAIGAVAALLVRIRIPPAVVVILALAWLSWPVWLAPALRSRASAERTVAMLVAANPTFAIQGALFKSFNVPWAQYRIAYRLTNIGDDIPYQMPTSILRCVVVHATMAIIALLAAHWPRKAQSAAPPAHPPADQSPRST